MSVSSVIKQEMKLLDGTTENAATAIAMALYAEMWEGTPNTKSEYAKVEKLADAVEGLLR